MMGVGPRAPGNRDRKALRQGAAALRFASFA